MIGDQILDLCKNEGIKVTKLEVEIGASQGVLSRSISKKTDIQSKWLKKIIEIYPYYNSTWLLTGHGSMLSESKKVSVTLDTLELDTDSDKMIKRIGELIDDEAREGSPVAIQIKASYDHLVKMKYLDLKILNYWAEMGYSVNWILTGKGSKKMMEHREMYDEYVKMKNKIDEMKEYMGKLNKWWPF